MANNYKNAAVVLTSTGATDLYTCPSGRTAIVQSVNVANVDSSNRDVTVTLYDSSAATSYTVIYNATIPVGVSMNALSTPLVLEPGDIVRVQASAANTLHATASVMEQDATSIHVDGSITTAKIADDAVTQAKLASMLTTTLPTSPTMGEVIIYEADAANGVMWMLVYDGVGSYPWKYVGGSPLYAEGTGSATSSAAFIYTNSPSITLPLAGDYTFGINGFAQNSAAGLQSCIIRLKVGSTSYAAADATSVQTYTYDGASVANTYKVSGNAASSVATLGYAAASAIAAGFSNLRLTATPVRVG